MTTERLIIEYCVAHPDEIVKESGGIEYRYSWDNGCMQIRFGGFVEEEDWSSYPEMNIEFSFYIQELIHKLKDNDMPF